MHQITGHQIAAARSLLGLGQITFASLASIEIISLIDIEACVGPAVGAKNDIIAVIVQLEREGIVFVDPDGSGNEPPYVPALAAPLASVRLESPMAAVSIRDFMDIAFLHPSFIGITEKGDLGSTLPSVDV